MSNRISDKMAKAFERFNADLEPFRKETATLDKIQEGEIKDIEIEED